MREQSQWQMDGLAVTRATLSEINSGARERAELASGWCAEVSAARKLESGWPSGQAAVLGKILERGRVTLLSQKLEAQILKLMGDRSGLRPETGLAIQFAHQIQLLAVRLARRFLITGVERRLWRLYRKIVKLALADLCELDAAVAELYDLKPLCAGVEVDLVELGDAAGSETASSGAGVPNDVPVVRLDELERPPETGPDLCYGTETWTCTEHPERPVKFLLNYIFGFPDFRPAQIDSILQILRGEDTIALLPTGSGKSIIFQMLALLRPGLGLVVAPIVSLIYDQVDNLERQGIDRVAGITASSSNKAELMAEIGRGERFLLYVAPERLQIKDFQGQLQAYAATHQFAVLAIDEAHCVSEWGHDFRTSYLNLAKTFRLLAPGAPLLALTGTASGRILKEMCTDLGIKPEAVQRPPNFDRPEIHFEVVVASTPEKPLALRRILTELLPAKFGVSPAEFFRLQAAETMSGIIFCPHVSGDYGVTVVKELVKSLGLVATEYYGQPSGGRRRSGGEWAQQKQSNAARFKDNQVPLLVATKSFGMGVDKPNIRYTIHYCPPASIEAYYQEAGRGGRDRNTAWSFVIVSNDHAERNQKLLAADTDSETFRQQFKGEANWWEKQARRLAEKVRDKLTETLQLEEKTEVKDDIDRLLYFHLQGFPGPEAELQAAEAVLQALGDLSAPREVEVRPSSSQADSFEKSLYRLQRAGLIAGYTVNFASNTYQVELPGMDDAAVAAGRERLRQEITAIYAETEPDRRWAIGKIIETMTTAGQLVESAERDNYLRKEILSYLTSE